MVPASDEAPAPSTFHAKALSDSPSDDPLTAPSLGSFLYDTLQSLLDADPELCELGLLLPSSSASALIHSPPSPLLVIPPLPPSLSSSLPPHSVGPPFVLRLDEHALGIAFWAVPSLFHFSTATFRRAHALLPPSPSSPSPTPAPLPSALALSVLHSTRALLLINADHNTAWNARKVLLSSASPSPSLPLLSLPFELSFLSLVLSKHPKSSEAWAHRRWALTHLTPHPLPLPLLHIELRIAALTAERYPKNYHAWSHRLFALHCAASHPHEASLLSSELQSLTHWTQRHVSDHAALHYRAQVVQRLLALHPPPLPHLHSELAFLADLQSRYPAHEALWSYRRSVVHHLARLTPLAALPALEAQEREWAKGREAMASEAGVWASEADARVERLSCRTHCLYVAELCARRRYEEGEGKEDAMAALAAMSAEERAQWTADVQRVQELSDSLHWQDRLAFVAG